MKSTVHRIQSARRGLGLAVLSMLLFLTGCQTLVPTQLPAHEYEVFTPLPQDKRIMNDVTLKWVVREDAAEYCARTMRNRSTQPGHDLAFITPPMACAVWYTPRKECTIVTAPNVTHTVLGHELRHCFEGHFHH